MRRNRRMSDPRGPHPFVTAMVVGTMVFAVPVAIGYSVYSYYECTNTCADQDDIQRQDDYECTDSCKHENEFSYGVTAWLVIVSAGTYAWYKHARANFHAMGEDGAPLMSTEPAIIAYADAPMAPAMVGESVVVATRV
eukprot:FR738456.1.p1 GENE.FR738456.1~~FR738456.1.p1  ORF type:complete len:138 (+),score=4.60 FR738456.1:108-521(+)